MSQAIVNPEELRRFAARLKQFNNEMISQLTTLHGQLAGLSQTWRDREHDKFVEQFEQTLQVVKRFTESTNQHIPFLLRKAERIEEYLQQRLGLRHEQISQRLVRPDAQGLQAGDVHFRGGRAQLAQRR